MMIADTEQTIRCTDSVNMAAFLGFQNDGLYIECIHHWSILLDSEQRKACIESIRNLPDAVAKAVYGLTDEQLDTPYRAGGWNPRQVVHHLADSHMNALVRMKLILTEANPPLKGYNQDEWAKLPDVSGVPIATSLGLLRALHERWTCLWESVNDDQWTRSGIHSESGPMTLDSLLATYARHGEKHVGQILSLRKSQGW